jgi:AraC-like DNA-binding protein
LAKIAVISGPAEERGTRARVIATGACWSVSEVICTLGPRDRPFEEQHSGVSIAMVAAGTFVYHGPAGRELMTPGSLLLGSAGQSFECSHDHGAGDRCIAFSYAPEFFDRLEVEPVFRGHRVPALRALSPLVARAEAALGGAAEIGWEEAAVELAALASEIDRHVDPVASPASSEARVARLVRIIEDDPAREYELDAMAREARLSPYHFLRIFRQVTGITPHQHLLRRRLQRAAIRLADEPTKIVEIALDCGFGDVSNFNRSFRAELGVSPRAWRRSLRPSAPISHAAAVEDAL